MKKWLKRIFNNNRTFTKSNSTIISLSIIIGIIGGFGAIIFRLLILYVNKFFFKILLPFISYNFHGYNLGIILIPAIGGLIVGPIIYKYAKETKGHGVPEVIEAVRLKGGDIRPSVAFIKILVSSITIGSGGSAGREGPIVQIGSSVGSMLGQFFFTAKKHIRLMVACGATAGISATFNAPLGGAIFAMEVLSVRSSLVRAIPILLSAVVGDIVTGSISGLGPIFQVPSYSFTSFKEVPIFIVAGLFLGLIAIFWSRIFYKVENKFDKLNFHDQFKPMIGGLLVGFMGMFLVGKGIMGVGYDGIDLAMLGEISIGMLIILGFAKIIATSFTIGSGGSGGIFAPSLFIGTMFGTAFGLYANIHYPSIVVNPLAYSLIGMGAIFAGACRAPLTALIMIPEMTNNHQLLIPMMIVVSISYIISTFGTKDSMYLMKLINRGVNVYAKENILEDINVKDVMKTKIVVISHDMTIEKLFDLMLHKRHPGFPVVRKKQNQKDEYLGFIRLYQIRRVEEIERNLVMVHDLIDHKYPFVKPNDTVYHALNVMLRHNYGRIPVLNIVDNKKHIVGVISKTDVIKAYQKLI